MALLIKFEDQEYDCDLDDMDFSEARYIKRNTGLTILEFQEAVMKADPDALGALWWWLQKRAGRNTDMNKTNFKVAKFGGAVIEAVVEEANRKAAEEEANPTEAEGDNADTA